MNLWRKCLGALASVFAAAVIMNVPYINASASANAMIQFGISQASVAAGAEFSVTMTVSASEYISAIDAYVSYDSAVMTFVDGGEGVSGDSGLLHISQSEIADKKSAVQYSLKFKAYASGTGQIGISDEASVKDKNGENMKTTSNRISVEVTGGEQQPAAGELSSDNNLLSLEVNCGELEPAFDPSITRYSMTVDCETDKLYFSFKTSDEKAAVDFSGHDNLYEGDNKVRITVTAQNGDAKKYVLTVKKESQQETNERLIAEGVKSASGIDFNVYNEDSSVYIQNQYKFQIVDVDESTKIPSGYKKTSVLLYGVNVTAYTMENDLDSDYLLMYCLNSNGDKEFYQFDRQDKSLQRYTGDLIDKVNAEAANNSSTESKAAAEYESNLRQLAIIIAIISALCVILVMGMISIIMRQSRLRKGPGDELDF